MSRLTLVGVGQMDSRSYILSVENLHGTDTVPMNLIVRGRERTLVKIFPATTFVSLRFSRYFATVICTAQRELEASAFF